MECVVVDALVLSVSLLEDRGEDIGAARVAQLLLEPLFKTQDGLVDLVQPAGLILGLLPGQDVRFYCDLFREEVAAK
jgi:hypothetical protein